MTKIVLCSICREEDLFCKLTQNYLCRHCLCHFPCSVSCLKITQNIWGELEKKENTLLELITNHWMESTQLATYRSAATEEGIFQQFTACGNHTQSPSLFQNIFKFCVNFCQNFQKFCPFLPFLTFFAFFFPFSEKLHVCPFSIVPEYKDI